MDWHTFDGAARSRTWAPDDLQLQRRTQHKTTPAKKPLQSPCRLDDTCVWRRAPLCKMMRALNGVLGEGFYEIKGAGGLENRTGLNVSWLDLPQMKRTRWLCLRRFWKMNRHFLVCDWKTACCEITSGERRHDVHTSEHLVYDFIKNPNVPPCSYSLPSSFWTEVVPTQDVSCRWRVQLSHLKKKHVEKLRPLGHNLQACAQVRKLLSGHSNFLTWDQ